MRFVKAALAGQRCPGLVAFGCRNPPRRNHATPNATGLNETRDGTGEHRKRNGFRDLIFRHVIRIGGFDLPFQHPPARAADLHSALRQMHKPAWRGRGDGRHGIQIGSARIKGRQLRAPAMRGEIKRLGANCQSRGGKSGTYQRIIAAGGAEFGDVMRRQRFICCGQHRKPDKFSVMMRQHAIIQSHGGIGGVIAFQQAGEGECQQPVMRQQIAALGLDRGKPGFQRCGGLGAGVFFLVIHPGVRLYRFQALVIPRPGQEYSAMSKTDLQNAPILLREDRPGGICVITLNRPAQRNSLSRALLQALEEMLAEIAADSTTRVVVLAGAGTVFCAGHDLREITSHRADADGGRGFYADAMAACARVMQGIVGLPQPVIAAVQGVATAAGCQLVASCDLAVAAEDARFCTPGVDIGLFCSTPAVALARAVPRKAAMEMLLLGEMVPADEAQRLGLVNRLAPRDALMETALGLAARIAAHSAITVRMGKRGFNRQIELPLAEAYQEAASVMTENLMARDASEGIGAFLEKRHPQWEDR